MTELVTSVSKSNYDTVVCFEGVSGFPNNNGEYVDSPPFTYEDRTWAIRLYPAGTAEASGSCSCNLVKMAGPSCRASMEFRIMVNSGVATTRKVSAKTFNDLRAEWGIGHLINSYNIEEQNNPYVRDDVLTIKVSMTVYGDIVRTTRESTLVTTATRASGPITHIATPPLSAPPSYMASLFGQKSLADVTIVLSNRRKLDAHRVVLAMRSDVFKSMLSSRMAESNTNQIVIDDCEPKTVRAFIQYLYTDQLPANSSEDMLSQLLGMANKYQVPALEQACIGPIRRKLNSDNVLEILELATLYGASDLRRAALDHLADFSDRVAMSKGFYDKLASFWGNCAIAPSSGASTATGDDSNKPALGKSSGKTTGKRGAAELPPTGAPAGKKARRGGKAATEHSGGGAEGGKLAALPCSTAASSSSNQPNTTGYSTALTTSCASSSSGAGSGSGSGSGVNGTATPATMGMTKIPDDVCDVISALAGIITDRRNGNLATEVSARSGGGSYNTRTGAREGSGRHPASNPLPVSTPVCQCPTCRASRVDNMDIQDYADPNFYEDEEDEDYSDEYGDDDSYNYY